MLYKYKGVDLNGKNVSAKIEASTLLEAKAKLKIKKILYTSITEDKFEFIGKISFKKQYKIDALSLANLSRDLSIYLDSGISLVNAIKLLQERYKSDKRLSTFFDTISIFLDEGKTFYTALDLQKSVQLPDFYKQSVKISETSGLLQTVLLELSTFLKEQDRIKKQITTAIAYPLFILIVSFFVVGFMLTYIVPKITSIFEQYDQELPAVTTFVIALGNFFENNFQLIIAAFICTVGLFMYLLNQSKSFKYGVDAFLLKIPFFASLIELNELSRFSYMNSILIRSGVPIVQSINLSANILKNSVIRRVFEIASAKVVEGEKLSKVLDSSRIYKIDKAFVHAVSIGEETSKLSKILSSLAELYNESNRDKITLFLSLLEPVFMLIVGGIIGFIVMAMLLPIFSMNLM